MSDEHQPQDDLYPENSERTLEPFFEPQADTGSLRQYWVFFSGQLFSLFGSSVVQFAIIWWLTLTSESRYPGQTGLILSLASVAGFAPFVITSLFAGVLVDRWNRKIVIGTADATQAFVTAILIIAFYLGFATIPVVLVILAIRGMAQGFHSPATQAIIILMVPKEKLTSVNSYQYLFNGLINLVGPVIGAIAVEAVGVDHIATILWLDVISFAVAVIPLIMITIPDITKEKRERGHKNSFRREFSEGISFIVNAKGLLPLLLTFTFINILSSPVFMLLPLVVVSPDLLHGTATTLGVIMAASQGGSIIGSFMLTRRELFQKNVQGVALGQLLTYIGIFILALSALQGNLYGALIGMFITGISLPLSNIHSQNIWQSVVPPELQGRVMAVRQTIAWLMIPVAQLIGGVISDRIGIVNLFIGSVAIGTVILTIAWYFTSFQNVEKILGLDPETSATTSLDQDYIASDQ